MEVTDEGAKILSYLEFDRLIVQIQGSITTILEHDKRAPQDQLFWDITQPTHQQLRQAVVVNLSSFDVANIRNTPRSSIIPLF